MCRRPPSTLPPGTQHYSYHWYGGTTILPYHMYGMVWYYRTTNLFSPHHRRHPFEDETSTISSLSRYHCDGIIPFESIHVPVWIAVIQFGDHERKRWFMSEESPVRFFLDTAIQDETIGRLVFCLPQTTSLFPLHSENLLQIVSQERRSIDPLCHYINCEFNFSPQFIQNFPQYRWAHVLIGRNRNAVGRPTERIVDTASLQAHTHKIYGGIYYGLDYQKLVEKTWPSLYDTSTSLPTAVLTLPMTGPGRGFTQMNIVRVEESPPQWKERLLLNSAVLGWLEPSSMPVLRTMAMQQRGPPTVVDSGLLMTRH